MLEGLIRGKTLPELQILHSHFLLFIQQNHGVAHAMRILGTGLQVLAAASDGLSGLSSGPAETAVVMQEDRHLFVARRWQVAARKAAALPDAWERYGLRGLPLERATRHRWHPRRCVWFSRELLVRVERAPFAKGSMRVCHRMRAEPFGLNWVAKRYLSEADSVEALETDVKMQMRAKDYAQRFNECGPPKQVDFLEASLVLHEGGAFAVEAFLDGPFTKHSNNAGFVADDVVRLTPHAFSHFTFEASHAEEIVVDIQGVDDLYTDPQIHSADGSKRYGRGDMGMRGIALFFASHRCNSICRRLRLTHFSHAPSAGDDNFVGTEVRSPRGLTLEPRLAAVRVPGKGEVSVIFRNEVQPLVLSPPRFAATAASPRPEQASMYAGVHYSLAMLHARQVQAGAEFIGQNVLASPAQGLYHLRTAAELDSVPAMLALACLHLQIRPRKGVLRALSTSQQLPLVLDEAAALPYILRAAERGVASAMAATAHAYELGLGCPASAALAVRWYRAALSARGSTGAVSEEENDEDQGARLPGGEKAEHEMFAALASLHERGGNGLTADSQLAWQFQLLSRSSARRELEEAEAAEDDAELS